MIKIILVIVFIYLFFLLPELRYSMFHLPKVSYNCFRDIRNWFKYKRYNEFTGFGKMVMYVADDKQPFGSGKSLNLVRAANNIYNQYNNLPVWSESEKKFVKQKIQIVSNVQLYGIPYIPFVSERQIIDLKTEENVITIFLLDEVGTCFNSRDWKTNLTEDLLNSLLQQRKHKIAIWGTVQDFSLMDATMRKLTTYVYTCRKRWRFLVLKEYYAKDIERAQYNSTIVQQNKTLCRWATDKLYNSYSTNQIVEKLKKDTASGKMLTNKEILESADGTAIDMAALTNVRRRYKKRVRK